MLAHTNFINASVITNEYDVMNRLVRRWSGSTLLESYAYTATGPRATRTDQSGSYAWVYDTRDRVRTNITPVGKLYYTYDGQGNLTGLLSSTPYGTSVAYEYDALNRLTNVVDNHLTGTKNTAYTFDAVGNLKGLKYPNAVTNAWEYDTRNRLTNEVWKLNTASLGSFFYQLAVAGNRTNLSETVNAVSRTYSWSYDKLYRLTNESISSLAYAYDRVSNRTNRSGTLGPIGSVSYAYNTNDWLTTDGYDANGNTTNSASIAYAYDWANRLTNSGSISIVYNADGHRIRKTTATTTTLFLVDQLNLTGYPQVLEELTVFGSITNLSRAYTYGLDLISQRQSDGTTHFYGYDGHGSVRFLANGSGTITDTYAYDAYGTLIASNGSSANVYLYTGEQFDPDLGFYFLRARYLNPNTGRFCTMDSFGGVNAEPSSLHKYLYAQGDPINTADPSGNWSLTELLVTGLQVARMAIHAGFRVWAAYDRAQWVRDGLVILGKLSASGAVDPLALSLWASDFLPFKKAWDKVSIVGNRIMNASGPLNRAFKVIIEAGGRTKRAAQQIGNMGAAVVARKLGMRPTDFRPRYHGIDDIYEHKGKFVIVEAKGGTGDLAQGQMSQTWIRQKIKELKEKGDPWGDKLEKAYGNKQIQGMVVRTRIDANDVVEEPEFILKELDEIGQSSF
jgi:RHS repeat-associated protein